MSFTSSFCKLKSVSHRFKTLAIFLVAAATSLHAQSSRVQSSIPVVKQQAKVLESHQKNAGSIYVSLDSWVYPSFERLVALGYISTAHLGIRPWTRMECVRLLQEAQEKIHDGSSEDL